MSELSHLAILVSAGPGVADAVSAAVELSAVFADGRRVVLLDDRGFSSTGSWGDWTREQVEAEARVVVGPDEPFDDGVTPLDMKTGHWRTLAQNLSAHGLDVEPAELAALEQRVAVTTMLAAYLSPRAGR